MDQYVLENMFSWLPTRSLLRFQSVCKTWNSIISDRISSSDFRDVHLDRILKNPDKLSHSILITSPTAALGYNACLSSKDIAGFRYNACLSNKDVEKAWKYLPKPAGVHSNSFRLIGSYNGLICLHDEHFNIVLWNPCMGLYETVEKNFPLDEVCKTSKHYSFCGFGPNSSAAGGYVIVLGYHSYLILNAMDNKLGRYMWKNIQNIRSYNVFESIGVLVNGNLHWPASGLVVVSYNLNEQKLREFRAPTKSKSGQFWEQEKEFRVGNFREKLFVIFKADSKFEIWILEDNGVRKIWKWLFNIEGLVVFHDILVPLGFLKNGDIIIEVDRRFIAQYSFAYKIMKVLKQLPGGGTNTSAISFVETLAIPSN
ncbi:F-box/kelch-repeat protein At3g23880-like [Coffea arabica]|uniref:F-box/kelch-repeat protein At3g23880-like n=1 Tax=Coffea arabica TaxID=13443 RepID=A0A6P6TW85_COFAR|nr:F-box/kelch-repeat protein At3g23880-like [Coffea arabica]XP_027100882.1 F-box/kelch-repeat protein At3g23880-like [Coffea arabica]